LKEMLCCYL